MSEFELSNKDKSTASSIVMALIQYEVNRYPIARSNHVVNVQVNNRAIKKTKALIEQMLEIINEFPTEPTMTLVSVDELLSGDELLSEEEEEEE